MQVFSGLPAGTQYISWWPGSRNKERDFYWGGFDPVESYEVEQSDRYEGRKSDRYIDIYGLDETKIKTWWVKRTGSKNSRYSVTESSCATTVFLALVCGGSYKFTPWYYADNYTIFSEFPPDPEAHDYPTFTPQKVFDYAMLVSEGAAKHKKRNAKHNGKFAIVEKMKDPTVRKLLTAALRDDGRLSFREVKLICQEVKAEKGLSEREIDDLKRLVSLSKSMDKESKRYVHKFILKNSS